MLGGLPLFGALSTWTTPVWLICVGVAAGLATLVLGYGVLYLASRRAADAVLTTVREGILLPIFYLAAVLTGFAIAAVFLVPGLPYAVLGASVARLSAVGGQDFEIVVPPATRSVKLEDIQLRL